MKTGLLIVLCLGWIGCDAMQDGVELDAESDEIQAEASSDPSETDEPEGSAVADDSEPMCLSDSDPGCPAAAEPIPAGCPECVAGVPPPPGVVCSM